MPGLAAKAKRNPKEARIVKKKPHARHEVLPTAVVPCIYQGMNEFHTPEVFLSVRRTAARLGVPAAWLRTEALAGRVPYLRAGRQLLFNPLAVETVLLERAIQETKGGADAQG